MTNEEALKLKVGDLVYVKDSKYPSADINDGFYLVAQHWKCNDFQQKGPTFKDKKNNYVALNYLDGKETNRAVYAKYCRKIEKSNIKTIKLLYGVQSLESWRNVTLGLKLALGSLTIMICVI